MILLAQEVSQPQQQKSKETEQQSDEKADGSVLVREAVKATNKTLPHCNMQFGPAVNPAFSFAWPFAGLPGMIGCQEYSVDTNNICLTRL